MKKFLCKNCKYEFNNKVPGKEAPPEICPYCGEKGHVQIKKHIVEDL